MDKIIKLNKGHIEQLADIDFECEHPVDVQRNLSRSDMKKYILKRINKKQEIFFGYQQNEELIGYVTIIPFFPGYKHCEVYWLAVKKKFQKQGIGRKLMGFVENFAKKKNFRKVYLYTRKEMKGAQSFYKKIGYHFVNEFKDYYGFESGNTTAVLYAKSLGTIILKKINPPSKEELITGLESFAKKAKIKLQSRGITEKDLQAK